MKTRYGLNQLSMKDISRSELTQLVTDTTEAIKGFVKTNNKEGLVIAQNRLLTDLLTRYQKAQDSLKATGLSGQLEAADLARDRSFQTLSAFVRAHAYIRSEGTQRAYQLLSDLISDYKTSVTKSYEVQTAELTKFLGKLKEANYQVAINQLNLQAHVEGLTVNQTQFEDLYKTRISQQAALTPGQLKTLRREVEVTYRRLVDLIALTSACQPDHAGYKDLLATLNAIRRRYRKPKKNKKD